MEKPKLFLLDAMALIYRAYFALNKNPRVNSKGMNTSAVLGFVNTLIEILKKEQPTHIGVAFDTVAPTIRQIEYIEYKANRERMPEDISVAIPYIKQIIEAFNIPILFAEGYEADDVIGTLSKRAEASGFTTFMMTPDKDFGQLVSENIFMYKPARMGNKAEVMGVKEVCEKFEIENPLQVIDILGLWGDASDNIPGIPGIGEKRAKELLKKYYSVEGVIEHASELKGKQKENVIKYAEQGIMSKGLATIILDVPVDFDEEKLKVKAPDYVKLKELFDELEFRNLGKRFFQDAVQTDEKIVAAPKASDGSFQGDLFNVVNDDGSVTKLDEYENINTVAHKYTLIDSEEKEKDLLSMLKQSQSFCFDTETTGLDTQTAELVGIAFSTKIHEAFYVPFPANTDEAKLKLEKYKSLFADKNIEKVGQNLKYDISILLNYEIEVQGKIFDTMIAHYLLQPELRHNMDYMAETLLNYSPVSIETLIGKKGKNQGSMRNVSVERLAEYAGEDADITLQLKAKLAPQLRESKLLHLFENIEVPLITTLAEMEKTGVRIDTEALKIFSQGLNDDLIVIQKKIFEHAKMEFLLSSPKQLGEVLFDRMKIVENPKRTKTKQYSTSEEVLSKLVNKHPIIPLILEFRSLSKLKNTYVDALPNLINQKTGRIHTTYTQTVTSTGRLSSQGPNLQNIPIRTEKGREIRKSFIPLEDNHLLLAADYSQIELRIIAELSEDESMMRAFREGIDIHTLTASKVYKMPIDAVSKEQRQSAKMVNFGIIYGISAFGLSERLRIKRTEAKELIDQYFLEYPAIKEYMHKQILSAKEHGFVETIMKRRRYLPEINSANGTVRSFAERNAINAPIQGSSADMIKIAMINIQHHIKQKGMKSKMILQVHDELVLDVPLDEVESISSMVKSCMTNAIRMKVPIEVDINTAKNWLEAH
jgi:DNA polymerase I